MEIEKNIAPTFWLFADNIQGIETFEFVDAKTVKSKKGTEIPVFVMLGHDNSREGEFLLSTWNIANLDELLLKFGSDSSKWGTPKFTVKPFGKTKKITLEVQ